MAIHKILIDDFIDNDYVLIAIHTSLEDYRLAYFLNKTLHIQLHKNKSAIEIKTKQGIGCFNHYIYDNEIEEVVWNLIENKTGISSSNESNFGIFTEVSSTAYLVPEYKKADFILKIENTDFQFKVDEIIQNITNIDQITMIYSVDKNKIKSKNNLIF